MILEVLVIILILILVWKTKEQFSPYASYLVPQIYNSTVGFDYPNWKGDNYDPYYKQKYLIWKQIGVLH